MKFTDQDRREKEFFDRLAKKNCEYWGCETKTGQYRLLLRGKFIKQILKNNRYIKILDLGCGFGTLTQHLLGISGKIYGVDISPASIAIAKKKVKSPKVFFKTDNAHDLSFKNGFFDLIVGNAVLHHLNVDKALFEIFRTLKRGGKIIFFEPNLINPEVFLERKIPFIRRLVRNSKDETAYIRWSLKTKIKKTGFTEVSVEPYDFLYPALPISFAKFLKPLSDFLEKFPIIKELSGSLKITATKR